MKVKRFDLIAMFFLAACGLFLFVQCAGDDDDDSSQDPPQEDDDDSVDDDDIGDDDDISDDDDDNDDNDDSDDDDDNDDDGKIVYDDGSAESGMSTLCAGCVIVQGYTPTTYPAQLTEVEYYVDSAKGIANEIRLYVYLEVAKESQPVELIYFSNPLTADTADGWNSIDLSDVQQLQNYPVVEGRIWIGFSAEIEAGNGPFIGWDYQGTPDNEIWYYSFFDDDWTHLIDYNYTGVLMIRPTFSIISA